MSGLIGSRFAMFGANIFLLIGALILAVAGIFVVVAMWTGFNILTWRASQKKAEIQRQRERYDEHGNAYPPASRGLCMICETVHSKVYHLPDGVQLCPAHYAEHASGQQSTSVTK